MPDSARFALHRPEFVDALVRGEEKIAALMQGCALRLDAGEVLIRANTDHSFVYRLREGWVCRSRELEDGRSQFILVFLPGDLFGVKSIFMRRHPDEVVTLCDAVVERINFRRLHDAYVQDSDVASRCTWQVMEEERRLHNWIVGLGQGDAEERMALLMVDFRGRLVLSGSLPEDSSEFDMPLTQQQIAAHLGITAVHVNRVLKSLRERNIMTVREGRVAVHDLTALTRCAGALLDTYEREVPEFGYAKSG
jgi:CRP/FNR family transcriptional regulator